VILNAQQLATAARKAGFTGQDVAVAVAVALAESSGNTEVSHVNSDGSTDYGAWQINSVHSDLLSRYNWRDPVQNAQMAKQIHDSAGGWRPWTTYNSGAYLVHMSAGISAMNSPDIELTAASAGGIVPEILGGPVLGGGLPGGAGVAGGLLGGLLGGGSSSVSDAIKSLGKFLVFVADPNNWLRVAEFVAGLLIVAWGLWHFIGNSPIGGAIKSTAKSVAEAGAVAVAA
jgi:hypothetical protein